MKDRGKKNHRFCHLKERNAVSKRFLNMSCSLRAAYVPVKLVNGATSGVKPWMSAGSIPALGANSG